MDKPTTDDAIEELLRLRETDHTAALARGAAMGCGRATMTTPQHRPISGPLRRRINRLAHAIGQREEARWRAAMLAEEEAARTAGAGQAELIAMVAAMEARHAGE